MCYCFSGCAFQNYGVEFEVWFEREREREREKTCGIMICGMNNFIDRLKFVFSPDVILCG